MNPMRTRPLRRILLSTVATVSGAVLLLALKPHSHPAVVAQIQSATPPSASVSSSAAPSESSPSSSSPSSSSSSKTKTTRKVTGDTVQTRFGPVQVQVTLTGTRISAVTVLQVPSENPRDQEIAQYAVPQLTQEAITAQSASIDTVSGATYTSEGYVQSLQSALDKA
jgi:uncharacterized protein with FMN-binding domain